MPSKNDEIKRLVNENCDLLAELANLKAALRRIALDTHIPDRNRMVEVGKVLELDKYDLIDGEVCLSEHKEVEVVNGRFEMKHFVNNLYVFQDNVYDAKGKLVMSVKEAKEKKIKIPVS